MRLLVIILGAGTFGAIIGTFLNIVIHRLPREESIMLPVSRCPSCGATIAIFDNLLVLGYVILRGRCRSCKTGISFRYPSVEAMMAFLCIAVVWRDGLTFVSLFASISLAAITALIFINAEPLGLPNAITYPGIAFSPNRTLTAALAHGPATFRRSFDAYERFAQRLSDLSRIVVRRGDWSAGRRGLVMVNGLNVGKTPRR